MSNSLFLSDRPRVHVTWLWRQLTSFRGTACSMQNMNELIEFVYDSDEFDMHEDGYRMSTKANPIWP